MGLYSTIKKATLFSATDLVDTSTGAALIPDGEAQFTIQAVYTDQTPALDTFIDDDVDITDDATGNSVNDVGHLFITGLLGQLTTSGTLPAGLSLATNYYIIKLDADNYQFAASLADAQAGTDVDITAAAGGGTHTFTPTSASGDVKLQGSQDAGTTFTDLGISTGAFTASGAEFLKIPPTEYYEQIRAVYTHTSGVFDLTLKHADPLKNKPKL